MENIEFKLGDKVQVPSEFPQAKWIISSFDGDNANIIAFNETYGLFTATFNKSLLDKRD